MKVSGGEGRLKISKISREGIFSNLQGKNEFYLVPIYVSDTIKPGFPNKSIVAAKKLWIEMDASYKSLLNHHLQAFCLSKEHLSFLAICAMQSCTIVFGNTMLMGGKPFRPFTLMMYRHQVRNLNA